MKISFHRCLDWPNRSPGKATAKRSFLVPERSSTLYLLDYREIC
jgi:hypothetical protein